LAELGVVVVGVKAAAHIQQFRDGDVVAVSTPGRIEIGSSRLSLPSWASSTITAAVIVLVLEAIRKWVSALVAPNNVVPWW
jgi:hypothetical protein